LLPSVIAWSATIQPTQHDPAAAAFECHSRRVKEATISTYRFFQDAYIGGLYFQAGSVASTQDVGGLLPTGWSPGPYVDPLDAGAVAAFYAAGPRPVIFQFGTLSFQVSPPKTYWRATPIPGSGFTSFQLTGLGAGLSPICA
jgi:hypothetical protein